MTEESNLLGLLRAYYRGDRLARAALVDWLEESGDARADAVRQEGLDWDAVARQLWPLDPYIPWGRWRWYVDCARVGSPVLPEVAQAVQEARRRWLQKLFPEVDLSAAG